MKKSVLCLSLIMILSDSCEKNELIREDLILPDYGYINKLVVSADILWVISSKPNNPGDFIILPPYQISKINLNENKIIESKEIPPSVSIALDNDQAYLATYDRRILRIKPDLSTEQLFSIPKINLIRMMRCDKNNDLWIATNDGGLYLYDGKDTLRYNSFNSILNNNCIPSITLDSESNIWLLQGTDLFKIDNNKTLSKDPYQLPIDKPTGVFNLSSDGRNTLFGSKWDGNYHQIIKKELNKSWAIINPPTSSDNRPVSFIKSDNYGTIWICYSDYPKDILAYFENDNWVEVNIPLDEVNILDIETFNNQLFLGTPKGIYKMTKK